MMRSDLWLDIVEASMQKHNRQTMLAYAYLSGALSAYVNDSDGEAILQTLKQGA